MQSGVWETIVDTLYWIQVIWVLSGFALMAYLAFKIFPFRDESENFLSSPQTAMALRSRQPASLSFDGSQSASKPHLIVAGSYRFEVLPDSTYPLSEKEKQYQ